MFYNDELIIMVYNEPIVNGETYYKNVLSSMLIIFMINRLQYLIQGVNSQCL